jgi:monoamine oxidase
VASARRLADAGFPVVAFSSGQSAIGIEAMPDPQIVALAMERLRGFYGNEIPEPLDHEITRWHSDPFSLGSYSYFTLTTELGDRAILAEPVGDELLFAGEATMDRAFAQVPGAYMSGLREADRIIARYRAETD